MKLRILSTALFTIFCLAVQGASSPQVKFEIGQAFPDLILPSLEDGRPLSLARFRGTKVLLHIFASW